jgi:hypothetical protein
MRAQDFKQWVCEVFLDDEGTVPNPVCWTKLVKIIQHMWYTGEIPTKLTWTILVLIPKGDGNSRGIGLMETLQKLSDIIMDTSTRIKAAVSFHSILHGAHRGTGTS